MISLITLQLCVCVSVFVQLLSCVLFILSIVFPVLRPLPVLPCLMWSIYLFSCFPLVLFLMRFTRVSNDLCPLVYKVSVLPFFPRQVVCSIPCSIVLLTRLSPFLPAKPVSLPFLLELPCSALCAWILLHDPWRVNVFKNLQPRPDSSRSSAVGSLWSGWMRISTDKHVRNVHVLSVRRCTSHLELSWCEPFTDSAKKTTRRLTDSSEPFGFISTDTLTASEVGAVFFKIRDGKAPFGFLENVWRIYN